MTSSLLPDVWAEFVELLKESTAQEYGDKLEAIVHFGSTFDGIHKAQSDVDLFIIARALPADPRARYNGFENVERRLASTLIEIQRQGVTLELSPILRTPEEAQRFSILYLDWLHACRILYDANGTAQILVDRTREWVTKSGASRVTIAGVTTWRFADDPKQPGKFPIGW